MTLRLHGSPDSASLVIRIALEGFGLSYEDVAVDRAAREHKSAAYRAMNPQGLIPVLEDGGTALFETGAILLHLVERTGSWGSEGPPAFDASSRAIALPWLFFLSNTLHADLRIAFYAGRYAREGVEAAALSRAAGARVAAHLDLVDAAIAERGGVLGPTFTVCDAYLGACCRWARLYPRDPGPALGGEAMPTALAEHLARIEQRPEVRRAMAADRIPAGRPFTAPEPPDLPQDRVTG